jgi:uncharacterized membrane protein
VFILQKYYVLQLHSINNKFTLDFAIIISLCQKPIFTGVYLQTILYPKKNDLIIASLTALAIAIHIVESSLPSIIPGIKPGLSNVITLICLFTFGFKIAAQVSLLRVFISSLLIGSFLSPTFILSLTGAVSSLITIACLWIIFKPVDNCLHNRFIGPIGMAVVASLSHMLGQFYVAWFLYVPHPQLFKMLPIFITISVILGVVSGILTLLFLKSKSMFQITQHLQTKELVRE